MLGVPGALIGAVLAEIPGIGRKGALSVSTILTGVFLFASTTATNSDALLGWNSAYSFASNISKPFEEFSFFPSPYWPFSGARGVSSGLGLYVILSSEDFVIVLIF